MRFEWRTSLQTKLLQIGWTAVKRYFPVEKHFLVAALLGFDVFCLGEKLLEGAAARRRAAKPCPLGHRTGWRKEAQSSWGDYFFNKRKHSKGKCLKAVVIWREMTKWLLWLKTKQNTTAAFFIFVRNAVQGGRGGVNCVEAKENRNQRQGEKEG